LNETLTANYFDVVYFDAFSPESQPELWSSYIFEKLYGAMRQGGLLVTYCAKGEVKRTLKKIGFTLESLPGPPGKREMTRATKPF
jgi:tRNA U34 5-methylaminomethyl-2-thiouridine-forming methyltransferase MnmC